MSEENSPSNLFPPGFYERMEKLARQDHPQLRESARAEFFRRAEPYIQAAVPGEEKLESDTSHTSHRKSKALGIGLIVFSGGAVIIGFVERNVNSIFLGTMGAVKGVVEVKRVSQMPTSFETQPHIANQQFEALNALIPLQPHEEESSRPEQEPES